MLPVAKDEPSEEIDIGLRSEDSQISNIRIKQKSEDCEVVDEEDRHFDQMLQKTLSGGQIDEKLQSGHYDFLALKTPRNQALNPLSKQDSQLALSPCLLTQNRDKILELDKKLKTLTNKVK